MATASQLPPARSVFYDANGNPLSGGLVHTYVAGTTTPAATWQDIAEATPNSNPVVLDAAGSCLLFGNGSYSFAVTDSAGNSIPAYSGLTYSAPTVSSAMQPVVNAASTSAGLTAIGANGGTIVSGTYVNGSMTGVTVSGGTVMAAVLSNNTITGGTITGLTTPLPLASGGTGVAAGVFIRGQFANLKISVASNSTVVVTADAVGMVSAAGTIFAGAVSATISTASTGLNGLDTGTIAASTLYNIFAVSNGTATGAVLSLSASVPNAAITANYPFYARIGTARTNAGSNLLATLQKGRRAQYVVGGVNIANLPFAAIGPAGNLYTPTWVAVALGNYIPPTASVVYLVNGVSDSNALILAPNNSYGAYNDHTNPAPVILETPNADFHNIVTSILLENTNFYWAANGASSFVSVFGWDDNL
jgi:hypothetical protein